MTIKTRGSAALDKAQRRLALLKSIDQELNLGHGLTIDAYSRSIEITRAALEAHNTLLSHLEQSRKTLTHLEKELSRLSERMFSGVATIYGRDSVEYAKAGGSIRRGRNAFASAAPIATTPAPSPTPSATPTEINNGNGTAATVI
jgi:hypothetical protein